jgi:hypothetical protein
VLEEELGLFMALLETDFLVLGGHISVLQFYVFFFGVICMSFTA